MTTALFLACGLLTQLAPAADAQAAYEREKAAAGRGAEAQVRLALWCDAHGLTPERARHLARAVLIDPKNAAARGLLGLVAYGGRWDRPESVADKVKADEALTAALAGYNARRAETPETADGQWALALWCEEKGLPAEAKAHFSSVTRLDPGREAAWKKLGYKKDKAKGRWVTDEQVAAEKAEAEAQKQADRHWKPLLTKYRGWLADKAKRDQAMEALTGISDPRAVPSICAVFVSGGPQHHQTAVEVLGHVDAAASTKALAFLAVFAPSAEVRRAATETLKGRDTREFGGWLVGLLRKMVRFEVRPVGGPGSPGVLFVEGQQANVRRVYAPPPVPNIPIPPGSQLEYDANGLPVATWTGPSWTQGATGGGPQLASYTLGQFARLNPGDPNIAAAAAQFRANEPAAWDHFFRTHPNNAALSQRNPAASKHALRVDLAEHYNGVTTHTPVIQIPVGQILAEYYKAAVSAELQLEQDVAAIKAYNADVKASNERILGVLSGATGLSAGDDLKTWDAWWVGQQGYAYLPPEERPRPTVTEDVPLAYVPQPQPVLQIDRKSFSGKTGLAFTPASTVQSCFGAGTLVQTLSGPAAIESVKVGDRVLTQDVAVGALGYQPVTVVHHNPPSPTFLIKTAGDTIVSSPFHRFWVAGKGWVMARDLEGGETVRVLGGSATVDSVELGPVQPVYNLDVAEAHDFFAGSAAALVHDNTLPDVRLKPFDAPR